MMNTVRIDMNDTTLDFSAMKYKFDKHFEDTKALDRWLVKLQQSNLMNNEIVIDKNFDELALEALNELAYEEQKYLIADKKKAIIALVRQLPKLAA